MAEVAVVVVVEPDKKSGALIGRPGTMNGARNKSPGTVGAACKDNPITFTPFTLPCGWIMDGVGG